MNWTGGNLQRHSRGKSDTVSQRQKAHFAKVRTRLESGAVEDTDHDISTLRNNFQDEECRETNRIKPTTYNRERLALPDPTSPAASEHLRTMEPLSSRARLPENKVTSVKAQNRSLIELQKQELLSREDWLGLAPTRPPRIQLPRPIDRSLLGKRRKLIRDNHAPLQRLGERQPSKGKLCRSTAFERFAGGGSPGTGMSIQIGSQALLSESELSWRSSVHQRSPASRHSSESMLLGLDEYCGGDEIMWDGNGTTEETLPDTHMVSTKEDGHPLYFCPSLSCVSIRSEERSFVSRSHSVHPNAEQDGQEEARMLSRDFRDAACKTDTSTKKTSERLTPPITHMMVANDFKIRHTPLLTKYDYGVSKSHPRLTRLGCKKAQAPLAESEMKQWLDDPAINLPEMKTAGSQRLLVPKHTSRMSDDSALGEVQMSQQSNGLVREDEEVSRGSRSPLPKQVIFRRCMESSKDVSPEDAPSQDGKDDSWKKFVFGSEEPSSTSSILSTRSQRSPSTLPEYTKSDHRRYRAVQPSSDFHFGTITRDYNETVSAGESSARDRSQD